MMVQIVSGKSRFDHTTICWFYFVIFLLVILFIMFFNNTTKFSIKNGSSKRQNVVASYIANIVALYIFDKYKTVLIRQRHALTLRFVRSFAFITCQQNYVSVIMLN